MKTLTLLILGCLFMYGHSRVSINKPNNYFEDMDDDVSVVKINKSGNRLLMGYDGGAVELWQRDRAGSKRLWKNPGFRAYYIQSLYFSDEINQVVAVYQQGDIVFFDAAT